MRILLVTEAFPRASETFVARQLVALIDAGVDAHVACYSVDHALMATMPELAGCRDLDGRLHLLANHRTPRGVMRAVRVLGGVLGAHPLAFLQLVRRLAAEHGAYRGAVEAFAQAPLLSVPSDVVHFQFAVLARDHVALCELSPRPVTTSVRGRDVASAGLDDPEHYLGLWRHLDGVHAVSHDLWRLAVARGCPPDMIHAVVTSGIDAAAFAAPPVDDAPAGSPHRPLRVLTLGRFDWKKGIPYGLAAVALLRDRGVHVDHHVVGEGAAREEIVHTVHDLGLTDTVTVSPWCPADRVPALLAGCDVVLVPSVSEGFGNVALEAQAAGRPVVCTDAEGLAENVVDGVTGFVVARRSPEALADRLALLARDPQLRRRLGTAGADRAARDFRPEDRITTLVEMFDAVTRAGRRSTRRSPVE